MNKDIRDIAHIDHKDVVELNFISSKGRYVFRRHFRQGLRSHIIEILNPADIEAERSGITVNGTLYFPKARPMRMLRIFRTRFINLDEALAEIQRVKITENYLTSALIAKSVEIIVDYQGPKNRSPLLCGLQEYVLGVILDPWNILNGRSLLNVLYDSLAGISANNLLPRELWLKSVRGYCSRFVTNIRKMIVEGGHVPDLAGVGNILVTPSGRLKLVDINNISEVVLDNTIRLDDKNYPVCDKSIEALALIEKKILDQSVDMGDPLYRVFLAAERQEEVKDIEKKFIHQAKIRESMPRT